MVKIIQLLLHINFKINISELKKKSSKDSQLIITKDRNENTLTILYVIILKDNLVIIIHKIRVNNKNDNHIVKKNFFYLDIFLYNLI